MQQQLKSESSHSNHTASANEAQNTNIQIKPNLLYFDEQRAKFCKNMQIDRKVMQTKSQASRMQNSASS